MDATWHSGPRGSTTRAHAAPTQQDDVCYYLHIYFTYYIVHNVQPSVYQKGIQPSESAFLLNPIVSFKFLSVGLKSHTVFKMHVTWTYVGIGSAVNDGALIEWTAVHCIWINARPFIKGVITDMIRSCGEHHDRPIAIQAAQFKAFYNASRRSHLDAPSMI